jgi:hypothetical protein
MIRKSGKILACLAAVAAAVLLLPAAPAGASGGEHPVPVFTHFQDDGIGVPSSIPCPNGQAIQGHADFGLEPGDTWHGRSVYDLCLVPTSTPGVFTYSGVETFTGTVDGCGTGTMTYDLRDGIIQLVPNPTAPNGFQRWVIRPDAGTGGLSGVSGGQGVAIFTIQTTLANEGFFAGFLTC